MEVVLVASLMDALLDFPYQKLICKLNLTEGIGCCRLSLCCVLEVVMVTGVLISFDDENFLYED